MLIFAKIATWILATFLFFIPVGHAQPARPEIIDVPVKIYSSFCVHPESGDVLGYQIVLYWFGDGPVILFQGSSGWPTQPQMTPVDIADGKIKFSIKEGAENNRRNVPFSGTISVNGIFGAFNDNNDYLSGDMKFLLRPNEFPTVPDCTDENYPYPKLLKK